MSYSHIHNEMVHLLNEHIIPFHLTPEKLSPIVNQIGDARIVLMGEASHGTREFYETRIALSQYLIQEKGFQAIAIEGDWPSAYQIHRYVNGDEKNIEKAFSAFKRFPDWMWRNESVVHFVEWLRHHNEKSTQHNVGFYGLDLYSLHESIQVIIDYLKIHEPAAFHKAIARYSCFDHVAVDPQVYGYLVNQSVKESCVHQVTEQVLEMQHHLLSEIDHKKISEADASYFVMQNARVVKNAEEYYRSMFDSRDVSWNIRDQHMAQTLNNLITHIESMYQSPAKIIVWAHNSHVGDARATEMAERHEINLGQIVREQYDTASYLLGFSTYEGTVRAATEWGGKSMIKKVVPSLPGSYEALFHNASEKNFFLNLRSESHFIQFLKNPELQRAIGVIYLPETERSSHYHFARLPYQFDGIIHLDRTEAIS